MTVAEVDMALAERFLQGIEANLARWKATLIFLECDGHTGHDVELASDLVATLNESWTLASTLLAYERTMACGSGGEAPHGAAL